MAISPSHRLRYPLHAILLMVLAWAFSLALIGISFLFCALMLPLIPVFLSVVFGVACLLGSVHDFVASRARVERSSVKLDVPQHAEAVP